jgi:PST family polysaccharide transporter
MHISKLIRSIFIVGFIHAISAFLTIAQIIYLTRILGVESWGGIVYLQLIVNYFIWFSNWGFYLHTTKKLSNSRNDIIKISKIFSTTILSQSFLTLISLFLATILIFVSTKFPNKIFTFFIVSGLLIGNLIQPLWLLNGLEKVKESAAIQACSKLLVLPLIFLLIHKSSDAPIFFIINICVSVLVGTFFLFWIKHKYQIKFELVDLTEIFNEIKISSHLFFSMIWANLYTTIIPMLIGSISGTTSLGYYSLADRIRSSFLQLLHPVTHVLFPRLCFLMKSNPIEAKRLLIKAGSLMLLFSLLCSTLIYFLASPIIHRMSGPSFVPSIILLKIMSLTIPFVAISEFIMYQVLIPTNRYNLQHNSRLLIFIFSLLLAYPAVVYAGSIGAAWINLFLEMLLVLFVLYFLRDVNRKRKF